jgi:hypothetical protein
MARCRAASSAPGGMGHSFRECTSILGSSQLKGLMLLSTCRHEGHLQRRVFRCERECQKLTNGSRAYQWLGSELEASRDSRAYQWLGSELEASPDSRAYQWLGSESWLIFFWCGWVSRVSGHCTQNRGKRMGHGPLSLLVRRGHWHGPAS